ncbi:hypothetical protein SDC9_68877 [bioreactor metagenome]|uniref:Uncharacterized protein n=1 Tax=bioreactor metagenome TaxID=1076179 RepID=A0A644Y1M4_9ZZZZ
MVGGLVLPRGPGLALVAVGAGHRRAGLPAAGLLDHLVHLFVGAVPDALVAGAAGERARGGEDVVAGLGGVAEELRTALVLVVLTDPVGRDRQRPQRLEEAAVGLVLPRHRAGALPAVAPQQVEAAVVAGPGVRVRRDVAVTGTHVERTLREQRPAQAGLRVRAHDVKEPLPTVVGEFRDGRILRQSRHRSLIGQQVVVGLAHVISLAIIVSRRDARPPASSQEHHGGSIDTGTATGASTRAHRDPSVDTGTATRASTRAPRPERPHGHRDLGIPTRAPRREEPGAPRTQRNAERGPRTVSGIPVQVAALGSAEGAGHLWVPTALRFWQASTMRAAMPASAALPQVRGSYCFLLPTSPSIFSTPS